jgi:hypothetical protein
MAVRDGTPPSHSACVDGLVRQLAPMRLFRGISTQPRLLGLASQLPPVRALHLRAKLCGPLRYPAPGLPIVKAPESVL